MKSYKIHTADAFLHPWMVAISKFTYDDLKESEKSVSRENSVKITQGIDLDNSVFFTRKK